MKILPELQRTHGLSGGHFCNTLIIRKAFALGVTYHKAEWATLNLLLGHIWPTGLDLGIGKKLKQKQEGGHFLFLCTHLSI